MVYPFLTNVRVQIGKIISNILTKITVYTKTWSVISFSTMESNWFKLQLSNSDFVKEGNVNLKISSD